MKKRIRKLLRIFERKSGILFYQTKTEKLLGKQYKVLRGTISKKPDYDDAWLFALAQDARIIFDIGCNIGQSAILMMHQNCVEEIILVDPNPLALGQAANNLIFNHLSNNARFVCSFASDMPDREVEFYTVGLGAAGSMYAEHAKTASNMNAKYSVPTTTLDILIEKYKLVPDLVKIDTEGAESLVLAGAGKLAAHKKTRFFVEMHSNPELPMSENAERVISWCHDNGYLAWYLKEKTPLIDPKQIAHRGRCHLLLLPDSVAFPEYLLHLKQGSRLEEVAGL